jgi:F-type H+-transporting ATPase subunit epsilon
MADTFQLEIVTPEKAVVREAATEAQIPGKEGYLGILPGHAPLITELAVGEITYKKPGGGEEHLAVAWGFAEVLPDKVIILAETAERAEDIDVARALEQKKRAEERLHSQNPDTDFDRARIALERAVIRIEVANRRGSE